MKRQRENAESVDLANCLMLLPLPQGSSFSNKWPKKTSFGNTEEFECKTCNRKFSSFQALGGHSASHKRQKQAHHRDSDEELKHEAKSLSLWNRPKMHECAICGLEFSLGQALGGHMRKHRGGGEGGAATINGVIAKKPPVVLNRSNSSKRIVMCLDLNLTPSQNFLAKKEHSLPLSLF